MAVSFKVRQEIYYRDGGKCKLCGAKLSLNHDDLYYVQMDHIKPRSQGGDNSLENLRAVCKPCNSMRNKYSGEVLKKKILKDIKYAALGRRHKKRLLDDIDNEFITLNDLCEIQAMLEKVYRADMDCLELLHAKIRKKEVEKHG
jgi:predicted restriction endonuclease